jgi:hypothetical protein
MQVKLQAVLCGGLLVAVWQQIGDNNSISDYRHTNPY